MIKNMEMLCHKFLWSMVSDDHIFWSGLLQYTSWLIYVSRLVANQLKNDNNHNVLNIKIKGIKNYQSEQANKQAKQFAWKKRGL